MRFLTITRIVHAPHPVTGAQKSTHAERNSQDAHRT
jgi:hypothetical protein